MYLLIIVPFLLQTLFMTLDEWYFHIPRGLPKWERIGHPLDTLSVLLCYGFIQWVPYSLSNIKWFIGLGILSCLMITKDEFVHKHHCPASEHWVHAILFINHPILLTTLGLSWPVLHQREVPTWIASWLNYPDILSKILYAQTTLIFVFLLYQIIYWNFVYKNTQSPSL